MAQSCGRHRLRVVLALLVAALCAVVSGCAAPAGLRPTGRTASPSPTLTFGRVTTFPLPPGVPAPNRLTAGPDGNLWLTAYDLAPASHFFGSVPIHDAIVRMTPGGIFTVFPLPGQSVVPNGIAAGPDGNVWFAEFDGAKVGRITPAGAITEFPVPPYATFPAGSQPPAASPGPSSPGRTAISGSRIRAGIVWAISRPAA